MKSREKTSVNPAIVKFGTELREFVYVATWIVPLTQWLYFAWIVTTDSIMGPAADKYWLPDWLSAAFVLVGLLLTLLCLLIDLVFFIKDRSVKNLAPLIMNASWIGFVVLAVMMRQG